MDTADKLALLRALVGASSGDKRGRDEPQKFIHPMELLKKARVPTNKLAAEARYDFIADAHRSMVRNKPELKKNFCTDDGQYTYAVGDLAKWKEAMNELIRCPDDLASVEAIVRKYWDSTSATKVRDAYALRTGSSARKAFRAAAQQKCFAIMQSRAFQDRDAEAEAKRTVDLTQDEEKPAEKPAEKPVEKPVAEDENGVPTDEDEE